MPADHLVIARPHGTPAQLMLLFHGVGGAPEDMVPLGERLAAAYPHACIVSVRAPQASDGGPGHQWFSVRGISEENRAERVAQALPGFIDTVQHWQDASGCGVEHTALIGFSQGAIMALESTRDRATVAGRVVSIGGRFALLPQQANPDATLFFLHGKEDAVIHYGYTVTAAEHIVALGGDVSADVLPHVGHTITAEMAALLIERLQNHVPQRTWRAALHSDAPLAPKRSH